LNPIIFTRKTKNSKFLFACKHNEVIEGNFKLKIIYIKRKKIIKDRLNLKNLK